MSCLPTFLGVTIDELVAELFQFLKEKDAELGQPEEDMGANLVKILEVCECCFKDNPDPSEVEGFFNSVVSLIWHVPDELQDKVVKDLCDKLLESPKSYVISSLKILSLLFHRIPSTSALRYEVYYNMVTLAGSADQIKSVFTGIKDFNAQFKDCSLTVEQKQKLLRLLYNNLLNTDTASQVLIELLQTYTSENASQAGDDAEKCIIASISDPSTYLLDHLLSLKPVKFLEGKPIHHLLSIFVSEKLSSYLKFYEQHKDFIEKCGLDHEANIHKMRLLTILSMACQDTEIEFSAIEKELEIKHEDVEQYIIDALKMKLMKARIDQHAGKIYVSSATSRTFGRSQWQQLHKILTGWQESLVDIQDNMHKVVQAQYELMQQQLA